MDLSEYEARAYLCLVQNGTLKVSKLSFFTGIPRTKVYFVLRKLLDLGLAVKVPKTPAEFAPRSPSKAFGSRLKECKEKANRLSRLISSLEEALLLAKFLRGEIKEWALRNA